MSRKGKIIQLPKPYISFSQVSLWLSSPERYKRLYFDGDDSYRFSNTGMTFGSKVADALENEELTGDLLTDTAIELLPKYDVRDEEISTTLKTKDGDVNVLGSPDSLDSKTKNFYEFKTGKIKWTQKKADNCLQLKFYAMLIYLEYNVRVKKTQLIWIETFEMVTNTDDSGLVTEREIKPTGHVETFEVKVTMTDILETMALTSRVAKEIEAEWLTYTPKPEIPF